MLATTVATRDATAERGEAAERGETPVDTGDAGDADSGVTSRPVSGRALTEETIVAADVLARVELLSAELELLRLHLDREASPKLDLIVSGVDPRQVLFQARSLWSRSDQLSFEQTRRRALEPEAPTGEIRPFHVWMTTDSALKRVREAKRAWGLTTTSTEIERPASTTPSDVVAAVMKANRQVNALMEAATEPRDVYRMVTQSVHIAARLLAQFPVSRRIPPSPKLVPGNVPGDVHARLLKCLALLHEIGTLSGSNVAAVALANPVSRTAVIPSDVYDMAALATAELEHFYRLLPTQGTVAQAQDPGPKTPSDVYQRVGILEAQLMELVNRVRKDPKWLSR